MKFFHKETIGDGKSNPIVIKHDLHRMVHISVVDYDNSYVLVDSKYVDDDTVSITFANPPDISQYRVYIS